MSDGIGVLSAHVPLTKRKKSSCGRTERSMPETSMPSNRPLEGDCAESVNVVRNIVTATAIFFMVVALIPASVFDETLAQNRPHNPAVRKLHVTSGRGFECCL